jgi:hypothetical protein
MNILTRIVAAVSNQATPTTTPKTNTMNNNTMNTTTSAATTTARTSSVTHYMMRNITRVLGVEWRQVFSKPEQRADRLDRLEETHGEGFLSVKLPVRDRFNRIRGYMAFVDKGPKTCTPQQIFAARMDRIMAGPAPATVNKTRRRGTGGGGVYKKTPHVEVPLRPYKAAVLNRKDRLASRRVHGSYVGGFTFDGGYRCEAEPLTPETQSILRAAWDNMFDAIPVPTNEPLVWDPTYVNEKLARRRANRVANRDAFTLEAVLALLNRKGSNPRRRGIGFDALVTVAEAFSNLSYPEAVAFTRMELAMAKATEFLSKSREDIPEGIYAMSHAEDKAARVEEALRLFRTGRYSYEAIMVKLGITNPTLEGYLQESLLAGTTTLDEIFHGKNNYEELPEVVAAVKATRKRGMGLKAIAHAIWGEDVIEEMDTDDKGYLYLILKCVVAALDCGKTPAKSTKTTQTKKSVVKRTATTAASTTKGKETKSKGDKTVPKAQMTAYKKSILTAVKAGKSFSSIASAKGSPMQVGKVIAELVKDGYLDALDILSAKQITAVKKVYNSGLTFTMLLKKLNWAVTGENFMKVRVAVAGIHNEGGDEKVPAKTSTKTGTSSVLRKYSTKQSSTTKSKEKEVAKLHDIKTAISMQEVLETLKGTKGLMPAFAIYNNDFVVEDNEHLVVAVTCGLPSYEDEDGDQIAANNNALGLTDPAYEWLVQTPTIWDKSQQPDSYFPHINSNKTKFMNSSPIGADAASVFGYKYTFTSAAKGGVKKVEANEPSWDKLAWTNFKVDDRSCKAGLQVVFESMFDGKIDRFEKGHKGQVPSKVAQLRNELKEAIICGEDASHLEKHGNHVKVYRPLDAIYEKLNGIVTEEFAYEEETYKPTQTSRHYFLVVGKVSNAEYRPYSITDESGKDKVKDGQCRLYCSAVQVYHVTPEALRGMLDIESQIDDHEWFNFLPRPQTEARKKEKAILSHNKGVAAKNLLKGLTPNRTKTGGKPKTMVAPSSSEDVVTPAGTIPTSRNKKVAAPLTLNPQEDKVTTPSKPEGIPSSRKSLIEKATEAAKPAATTSKASEKFFAKTLKEFSSYKEGFEELEALRKELDKGVRIPTERPVGFTPEDILGLLHLTRSTEEEKVEGLSYLYNGDMRAMNEIINGERSSANYITADACRLLLASKIYGKDFLIELSGDCDVYNLDFGGIKWTVDDVKDLIAVIHGMMGKAKARNILNKTKRNINNAIRIEEDADGHVIYIDDEAVFTIDENEMVYDHRGRAFTHTVQQYPIFSSAGELIGVDTQLCTSLGNLLRFFYLGYLPLITHWTGNTAVYTNTLPNVKAMLNHDELFSMTTDRVLHQNGGAQHGLMSSYQAVSYPANLHPFVKPRGLKVKKGEFFSLVWPKGSAEGARGLKRTYSRILGRYNSKMGPHKVNMMSFSIPQAHEEYGLDFHFTKCAFVAGMVGHVNLRLLQEYCPKLFKFIADKFGIKKLEEFANYIFSLTLKATKGLKRVYLSYAQATTVLDEKIAGWYVAGMTDLVKGALVKAAFAPTLVGAPGMSAWRGRLEDMPQAATPKRQKYTCSTFDAKTLNDMIFDFTSSNVEGLIEAGLNNAYEVTTEKGWNILTFNTPVEVKGNKQEILCAIQQPGGSLPKYLMHEASVQGALSEIRWKFSGSVDNKNTDLDVEYIVIMPECHGKLRSIAKAQYFQVDPRFADIAADLVHMQDGIKSDTIYSWLMVISNTIYHNVKNGSKDKDILSMYAMVEGLNDLTNLGADIDGVQVLGIEPIGVILGIYTPLVAAFEAKFGRSVWYNWEYSGTQGRLMYDLYRNNKDWTTVESFDTSVIPSFALREGESTVTFKETKDSGDKTNILVFVLNAKGKVVRYYQRAWTFVGTEETPLYNVELFESSTVKESVSGSQSLAAYVKALRLVVRPEDQDIVKEVQKEMIRDGAENIYHAKYLAAGLFGNTLGKYVININESEDANGVRHLSIKKDVVEQLRTILEDFDVDIELGRAADKYFFKKICQAFSEVVFLHREAKHEADETPQTKTSFWLPGLYKFSKLTSTNEENRSFVSGFVNEILLPLLTGKSVPAMEMSKVRGMMDSVMSSENTIKLTNARRCAGGKRISLPCIPCGETWVLYSEDTNSVYQEMKRQGIDVEGALRGELVLVMGNRAPMPLGPISRVRIIREINGKQYRTAFAGENKRIETLPLFYYLSPTQIGVDSMTVYLDGGDFDGDNHYLTPVDSRLVNSITTYQVARKLRSEALGYDMLSTKALEKEVYAADHYKIKSFGSAAKTLSDNLHNSILKGSLKSAADYCTFNRQAYVIQNKVVGLAYSLYMWGEILSEVANAWKVAGHAVPKELQILVGEKGRTLVLTLAEMYEVMLGGYDENVWAWYSHPTWGLGTCSDGNKVAVNTESIAWMSKVMDDMKADGTRAKEVLHVMNLASRIHLAQKKTGSIAGAPALKEALSIALVAFELGRGKFDGFNGVFREGLGEDVEGESPRKLAHNSALKTVLNYIANISDEDFKVVGTESISIYALTQVSNYLCQEMTKSSAEKIEWDEEDLEFFTNYLEGAETEVQETKVQEPQVEEPEVEEPEVEDLEEKVTTPTKPSKPAKTSKPKAKKVEKEEVKEEPSEVDQIKTLLATFDAGTIAALKVALGVSSEKEEKSKEYLGAPCFKEMLEELQAQKAKQTVDEEADDEDEDDDNPNGGVETPSNPDSPDGGDGVGDTPDDDEPDAGWDCWDLDSGDDSKTPLAQGIGNFSKGSKTESKTESKTKTEKAKVEKASEEKIQKASSTSLRTPTTPSKTKSKGKQQQQEVSSKKSMVQTLSRTPHKPEKAPASAYDAFLDAALRIEKKLTAEEKKNVKAALSTLTDEQQEVVKGVLLGHHVCLTGEGGSGKSYTVEQIRYVYDVLGLAYFVTGSTGTSVMNVKGHGTFNSIHGLSTGFRPKKVGKKMVMRTTKIEYVQLRNEASGNANIAGRFLKALKQNRGIPVLIIVDEVSMVDTMLLACANEIVTKTGSAAQWLYVGDPLQLLPVNGKLFFQPIQYFDKDMNLDEERESILEELGFVLYNLTQNLRARGDVEFIAAMNKMRLGNGLHKVIYKRVEASAEGTPTEDALHVFFNNSEVKNYNAKKTEEAIKAGAEFKKYTAKTTMLRTTDPTWYMKKDRNRNITGCHFDPIEPEMVLCVGMPVMLRDNLKDDCGRIIESNGSTGNITRLFDKGVEIAFDDGKVLSIFPQVIKGAPVNEKGLELGLFEQLPLHPAYALTVHKCQGLTITRDLVFHVYTCMGDEKLPFGPEIPNLLYVGCSRVTTSLNLWFDLMGMDVQSFKNWLRRSLHTDTEALNWVLNIIS